MAANWSITTLGKRVATRIFSTPSSPLSNSRRAAYSSSYDKNPDDHVQPVSVPEDVIEAANSGKYWTPHPQTGVFGPPGGESAPSGYSAPVDAATAASVLEEKAWFRPTSLEDLEKPNTHP
ncbi:unnamed protein product [Lupinus luteus]|uniref:Late embryogenesis abundant protein n=1 Tax=Lupinus luteus TaxID=3873 RepID=A0AAV1X0M3_LUPLU